MSRRSCFVVVALLLILTSCSSASDVTASATTDEPTTTTSVVPTTTTTIAYPPDPALEIPDELLFLLGDVDLSLESEAAEDAPSSGTGGPAKPATPTPPIPAGDPGASGYQGLLGTYGLHQVLASTSAPFPTPIPGAAPLTGLPTGSPSRPAVVVKIDNSSKARPQVGLNLADVVIEEEVEWGITRFAAIFHSNDTTVGPVRSGRTTDISFLSSLGNPALVYSGANSIFDALLLAQERVQNFSAARSGAFWRQSGRRAPSNLFAKTASFNGGGTSPPPWFDYRAPGVPGNGAPVSSVSVSYPNTSVVWQWDGASWLRRQNGSAHMTESGGQINAANVVVAEVAVVNTGLTDSSGGVVPEYIWAGSGPVSVFTDGGRIDGTWIRPTLADPAVLVANDGSVIELTPGRTWVELVTAGAYSAS